MDVNQSVIVVLVLMNLLLLYLHERIGQKYLRFYDKIVDIYSENLGWLNKNCASTHPNTVIDRFFNALEELSEEL